MKKGFTLIEMLGVIAVLAIIGIITIPIVTNVLKDSKENLSADQEKLIVAGARAYANAHPFDSNYTVSVEKLMDEGYIEKNDKLKGKYDVQVTNDNGKFRFNIVKNSGDDSVVNTNTFYAWNTTEITLGTSKLNDLVSTKTSEPYYTSAAAVMTASGTAIYNKYITEDNIIVEGYVCQTFGISGLEVCLQGGNPSYYGTDDTTGNWGKLKALSMNPKFTGATSVHGCSINSVNAGCYVGSFDISTGNWGYVHGGDYVSADHHCYVNNSGTAYCLQL